MKAAEFDELCGHQDTVCANDGAVTCHRTGRRCQLRNNVLTMFLWNIIIQQHRPYIKQKLPALKCLPAVKTIRSATNPREFARRTVECSGVIHSVEGSFKLMKEPPSCLPNRSHSNSIPLAIPGHVFRWKSFSHAVVYCLNRGVSSVVFLLSVGPKVNIHSRVDIDENNTPKRIADMNRT